MRQFFTVLPALCVLLSLLSAGVTLRSRKDRRSFALSLWTQGILMALSFLTLGYTGKFGPVGWEGIFWTGPVQALLAVSFSGLALLSLLGGKVELLRENGPGGTCFAAANLLSAALLTLLSADHLLLSMTALTLSVLATCTLVALRREERSLLASARLLLLHGLGLGLMLLGVAFLWSLSGTLSLPAMQAALQEQVPTHRLPLGVALWLILGGAGLSGGLFPAFRWLAAAHDEADSSASALLSALALPGSALLMERLLRRGLGISLASALGIGDILLVLGLLGTVFAGLAAIHERQIKHALAYSSSAQMGCIFLGLGLGTMEGAAASCFHILVLGCTMALLFLCAGRLSRVSGGAGSLKRLRGSAHRDPLAALGFTVGAISLMGIPVFGGFASKFFLASASIFTQRTVITLLDVAASAVLSALCYVPATMTLWERPGGEKPPRAASDRAFSTAAVILILGIFVLGVFYHPMMDILSAGIGLA